MLDEVLFFDTLRQGLWVALIISLPILFVALLAGVSIGLVQALTSIQEMTLSFIPKLAVMVIALIIFGNWQLSVMVNFFQQIFERIPTLFI